VLLQYNGCSVGASKRRTENLRRLVREIRNRRGWLSIDNNQSTSWLAPDCHCSERKLERGHA